MKYEVSEEVIDSNLDVHLSTYTENAGNILLASVNDKFIFIHMCMDYVEYFDNSHQVAAAAADIADFMSLWEKRGRKLYEEEV